jgi:hypothetical protein
LRCRGRCLAPILISNATRTWTITYETTALAFPDSRLYLCAACVGDTFSAKSRGQWLVVRFGLVAFAVPRPIPCFADDTQTLAELLCELVYVCLIRKLGMRNKVACS